MQLLYIYIANYANFEDAEFNFGGPYRFSYNKETNELTAEKTEEPIKDFFGENISNLTAIVGENGVGKTSFLKRLTFFNSALLSGHKYISVYLKNEKEICLWGSIPPTVKGYHGKTMFLGWDDESRPKAVYITTTLGGKSGVAGSDDLSTWNLIRRSIGEAYIGKLPLNKFDGSIQFDGKSGYGNSLLIKANNDEIERQIQFFKIGLEHVDGLSSFVPKEIEISVNDFPIKTDIGYKLPKLMDRFSDLMRTVMPNIIDNDGKIKITDDNEAFESGRTYLKLKLLDNLIGFIAIRVVTGKKQEEHINVDAHSYDLSTIQMDTFVEDSKKFVFEYYKRNLRNKELHTFEENLNRLIEIIDGININRDSNPFIVNKYYVSIREHEKLVKLNEAVVKAMEGYGSAFLAFSWYDLSSGEEAKLSIFSRVFLAKAKVEAGQPLVLLIDEGESHFHPRWQREFLSDLLNVVGHVFSKGQVQIIMTSNSPFLVSDIPKVNIIFLKNEGGKPVVSALAEHKETFGANIHLLLADSFFMNEGTMGKFAEKKIDELIAFLDDKESPIKTNEEAQKLINYIGEPILRNSLQKQLTNKRTNGTLTDHEQRIKDLEAEIEKLKGK